MLFINKISNAKGAIKYFDEGLAIQDYYQEKGEVTGKWHGKGAALLGLKEDVTRDDFSALITNVNPTTGEQLTARNDADRRPGYEFTFSVPKSVSIIYGINKDENIRSAFESSVQETMQSMENEFATRVRKSGENDDRITANGIWASFTHTTSRPVDGEPDPHLHTHVICANATFDEVENKWKAIELGDVKANGNYWQAVFDASMSKKLADMGYPIERSQSAYEIAGISRETIDKFSNRTLEIEQVAASDDKYQNLKFKSELGKKTRAEKIRTGLKEDTLSDIWANRLNEDERQALNQAKQSKPQTPEKDLTASKSLDFAFDHILERKSVATEKQLFETALKRGFGSVTVEDVKTAFEGKSGLLVKRKKSEVLVSTKEALAEEKNLIAATQKGRGAFKPINPDYTPQNPELSSEQKAAIEHALTSHDFISVITGGAGTGKTWSIKEIKQGVEAAGKNFAAFAPSAEASRGVQRGEGFSNAETITLFLQNPKLQDSVKNGVIWIDEAGMVGNKTMNSIIDIAQKQNARLLLSGDTKQHSSVEAGDALRIIQDLGGAKTAFISKIQRQKTPQYKEAVKSISEGDLTKGYQKLDKMGAIIEMGNSEQRNQSIAKAYISAVKAKETVIVVTPTHREGRAVTDAIRQELKNLKLIDQKEHTISIQRNLSFTEAQKQDSSLYKSGLAIQFHQNGKNGFNRGERLIVSGKDKEGNILVKNNIGTEKILPLSEAKKFQVFDCSEMTVAKGDKIRVTANGQTLEKKRLNNGDVFKIEGVDKTGNILLEGGRTLSKDFGNLTHGYYVTSHASQGKSVNRVLIAQSSQSFSASNKEQFYVSASRGKEKIAIYTDDKEALLNAVRRSTARTTVSDIAPKPAPSVFEKLKILYRQYSSKVKDSFVEKFANKKDRPIGNKLAILKPSINHGKQYGKEQPTQTVR